MVIGPDAKWKVKETPYLRDIMDELKSDDPVKMVVIKKGCCMGPTSAQFEQWEEAEAKASETGGK